MTTETTETDARDTILADEEYVVNIGFGRPSEESFLEMASHGPIVEVFAGSGHVAAQLRKRKVDVVAYDLRSEEKDPTYHHTWATSKWSAGVIVADAVQAVKLHTNRALLMIYPPRACDTAAHVLKAYQGNTLLYHGEARGGCTGSDAFFNELDRDWTVVRQTTVLGKIEARCALWTLKRWAPWLVNIRRIIRAACSDVLDQKTADIVFSFARPKKVKIIHQHVFDEKDLVDPTVQLTPPQIFRQLTLSAAHSSNPTIRMQAQLGVLHYLLGIDL
jgi:hypothetical protein